MSDTSIEPTTGDILHDSDIIHVVCCRNEGAALCGYRDAAWCDVDEPPDCVVCLDIEAETDTCPIDHGPCIALTEEATA